jgi:hypothetical protein
VFGRACLVTRYHRGSSACHIACSRRGEDRSQPWMVCTDFVVLACLVLFSSRVPVSFYVHPIIRQSHELSRATRFSTPRYPPRDSRGRFSRSQQYVLWSHPIDSIRAHRNLITTIAFALFSLRGHSVSDLKKTKQLGGRQCYHGLT